MPIPDSEKIKIVFLIGQLGFGGSERQLYLLLEYIDKQVFECHVVVFNPSPNQTFDDSLREIGVHVWQISSRCKGILGRTRYLYRLLRELSPLIIHSWTFHDNPYSGLIGWLAGVPVRVGSLRGSLFLPETKKLPFIYRLASLHSVSELTVNSENLLKEAEQNGYSRKRIKFIRNGVKISPADESAGSFVSGLLLDPPGNHYRIVGTVGNLRRVKNHSMFVKGMAKILTHFSDVKGVIVGQPISTEPDIPGLIESEIKELGLEDRVIIAGFQPDVPKWMHGLTVFCLTSDNEGTPNVVLEAMAASRPIVATRVGGISDLIEDGVNGFLVEPGDVEAFGQAVMTVLKDPKLAEKMGKANLEAVKGRFGCDRMADEFSSLYLESLRAKGCITQAFGQKMILRSDE